MLVPNDAIDEDAIGLLLKREYGLAAPPEFSAVGGDSWCYRADPWFVSVRRDFHGHVREAYEAACIFQEEGLDWVLAPVRGRSGDVVHDVDGYPTIVLPLLDERPLYPNKIGPKEAEACEQMVHLLHAVGMAIDLPREEFSLFWDEPLQAGVARAKAGAKDCGPYGERVSELVRDNLDYIRARRTEAIECRAACFAIDDSFVLTHGEAAGNLFATKDGGLYLMDWGELGWAPPERDLAGLRDIGRDPAGHPAAMRFYELRWIMDEISQYVDELTRPHDDDAQMACSWYELNRYL